MKTENGLILKKHTRKKQYLILICPEIEEWLLMNANTTNIDLSGYNLPSNLKGFKQITKTQNIDLNIEFYRFVKSLINNKAPGITTL